MSNGRNSYSNFNVLNTNTRLPKIDASPENSTALKSYPNGNISRQATSPTNVNISTKQYSNSEKLKHQHSNSVDFPIENFKSPSILSIGNNNELISNSLTNTNKLNSNLNSNSSFFNSSNVFILEETYKLNNGTINTSNGFSKNTLKRQNEQKSTSKIENGLNLPQVKQIERKLFCEFSKIVNRDW